MEIFPHRMSPPEEHLLVGGLAAFFEGAVERVCVEMDGRLRTDAPSPPPLLVAGAFNPVHEGHWGLAAAAAGRAAGPAAFELCVANVDKPPLSAAEVCQRLRPFLWRAPLWVTRAPTFLEKARLFPGTVFAVGVDTAARVLAPRYYAQGETGLAEAMSLLRRQGCRFLVACRADAAGNCLGLEDLPVPAEHADLFRAIPRSEFRLDVSSTALRQRAPV